MNRVLAKKELTHDKQIRIIFLASMIDWKPVTEHLQSQNMIRFDLEQGRVFFERAETGFYNDMELEQAQPFVDALAFQAAYDQPILSSEKCTEVPLIYLVCERDRAVPPDYQRSVLVNTGCGKWR